MPWVVKKRGLKRFVVVFVFSLSVISFIAFLLFGKLYFLDFSLIFLWIPFEYFRVFVHEAGHVFFGLLFKQRVIAIEIGNFPFKIIKIGRFQLRVNFDFFKFEGNGKTLLGNSFRSLPKFQKVFFYGGGILFVLSFLLLFFFCIRHAIFSFWGDRHFFGDGNFFFFTFFSLFLLHLVGDFFPKWKEGRPLNDAANLQALLFPKTIPLENNPAGF
jgi:hypothetical protein